MTKYSVQVDAKNLLVEVEGKRAKHGFITYRLVEAPDCDAAVATALQMLRDDAKLSAMTLNSQRDPPVMDVIEIEELEPEAPIDEQPGLVWYEMQSKPWWQFWRR